MGGQSLLGLSNALASVNPHHYDPCWSNQLRGTAGVGRPEWSHGGSSPREMLVRRDGRVWWVGRTEQDGVVGELWAADEAARLGAEARSGWAWSVSATNSGRWTIKRDKGYGG